jgi:hypothetical protein
MVQRARMLYAESEQQDRTFENVRRNLCYLFRLLLLVIQTISNIENIKLDWLHNKKQKIEE